MIVFSALFACSEPRDAEAADPVTSSPFDACDPAEIESLASKHGFQLVFEPCGSNGFLDFAWSTDGHRFYYKRGLSHRVVDAAASRRSEKDVPTSLPVGTVAWLTATRLVLPLGPAQGLTAGPFRVAVWDVDTEALAYVDLPQELSDPTDLARGPTPESVVFSALRDGERHVFRLHLASQEVTEPFPFLPAVDTFSWSSAGNGVVAGVGDTVTLYDATTGKVKGLWSPATRGTLHPGGRWLALEHIGEPVSVFQPVGVEELPADERAAALEKAKRRAAELPADYPREVRPPTLSFVDTHTARRYLITAVQGSQFEWWEARDFYASFTSWGFEQHQVRRNVVLGDLARWMLKAEQGIDQLGVKPATPTAPADAAATAPAEPAPPSPPPSR